jgi:hypothetical protein
MQKKNIFFASLKSMKKEVGCGVGSGFGSITQRYGSGDPEPDPNQNVKDPQHWIEHNLQMNSHRSGPENCFTCNFSIIAFVPRTKICFRTGIGSHSTGAVYSLFKLKRDRNLKEGEKGRKNVKNLL